MTKRFLYIFIAIIAIAQLAGCGTLGDNAEQEPTAAEIWADILESAAADTLPLLMELDDSTLASYYSLTGDEVQGFVGQIALMNVNVTEVLIVNAKKGKQDDITQAIMDRQALLEETWAEESADQHLLVQDYRLVENGSWILYVVAESADEIVEIFNNHTA